MDPVRYRILGTTQAHRPDGTPVPVGGARLRALLSVLALRGGRAVPAQFLVDEVWGADPPADAGGALQALVGRLRRVLGADAVESVDGGYRLAAGSDDIDLHRFERLTADGIRALADGDPAKAAGVLDDALALWRGPALADLPDRTAEVARWDTRRLDALRARHTAALALGQAEAALPELTALCDSHPLDEPLQALRLRALRDTGRAAEALAAYDDVRQLLAEQLGSDPGAELSALHRELLSPQPAPAQLGNLRARLTSFVGREADIEAIRGDLGKARLVTLLGPGGAGKTRLSQEAAETLRDAARDGIWLAELAPVDDPEAVPEAVLTAVGARETVLYGAGAEEFRSAVADRHDDPVERLVEHCARRRMLIVLDNCEHVVDAAARLAEHLLARCPGLTVLATSREPLGVPGEVLRPVEPLPQPYALRLFADRGAAARPGFGVDDDPEACAEICRRLDGLPLAIELAAARLRMLTPRQIADRLDHRFRLLTSGSRTVLPRQQTLRAVVDWSWDLLDEDERDVLRRLSVFAGGCDLPAAEAVCGPAALDALGSLVDKSLVVAAPSGDGAMRYRLLETVAEYAGERLDEAGQRPRAERAHLTYYRELARTTDPLLRGPGQLDAVERLQREYENLRTALRHAIAERDEQEALTLTLSLGWYWQMRDLRIEARNWCAEVMTLGPDPFAFAEPVRPAEPVWQRCTAEPPPYTGEVLAEARRGLHLAHFACMDTELDAWQNPAAQQKLRTIAATYPPGLPQSCRSPGLLAVFAVMLTGDMDAVARLLDACVETCRTTPGYEWELAATLQMRANGLANRPERAGEAARDADESLAIYERLGDAWGTAEALSARAEARERTGAYAEAAADYEAAIEQARRLGARAQEAVLSARLAGALLEDGQGERGERLLREVIDGLDGGHSEAMPFSRVILAGWLSITGRTTEAREQIRVLRENFGLAQFHVFDAFILSGEAWMDASEGHHEPAREKLRRALEQADDPLARAMAPQLVSACLVIAAVALAGSEPFDAARCLGAADALLPPGHLNSSLERECRARAVAAVRAVLDEETYEAVYAEGGELTAKEAAALV
ncbi:BTAD domain-containing putative transcriptional regulator [Streptomyces cupreus]|uniref:AfsR/SARP family transcriptional regulator n=1 Tax=Streptomyces cupreus TaxID=2759956 RepID=A0A7X1MBC9_9ACTN|nr:BTAD domain-containing putative transcriptional regulator [Streptomyces cupreus]MBC2902500.1 AfsR/SARP family transcriptional regulator [Streptomyces cupreus]